MSSVQSRSQIIFWQNVKQCRCGACKSALSSYASPPCRSNILDNGTEPYQEYGGEWPIQGKLAFPGALISVVCLHYPVKWLVKSVGLLMSTGYGFTLLLLMQLPQGIMAPVTSPSWTPSATLCPSQPPSTPPLAQSSSQRVQVHAATRSHPHAAATALFNIAVLCVHNELNCICFLPVCECIHQLLTWGLASSKV